MNPITIKKRQGLPIKIVIYGALFILLFCLFAAVLRCKPRPLIILTESSLEDQVLYDAWVEFVDKDIQTQKQRLKILKDLEKDFNPRALARRKKRRTSPGLFDERDFPLASRYLEGVAKTGAKIRVKSRWLNGVSILAFKKQIKAIKELPYVKNVTDFHRYRPRKQLETGPNPQTKPQVKEEADFYGRSEVQVSQLGLDKLHRAGYTGRGIVIAVIDCGFDLSHTAFRNPENPLRVVSQWDFVENDGDVTPRPGMHPTNFDHGTLVLGIIAAYAPKELIGTAYAADFILCNAEDGENEYYLEERWYVAAMEFAETQGADIVSSSLVLYGGYSHDQCDGKTAVMTIGMNIAIENGVICVTGSGNSGHDQDPATSHLTPPADAKNVISVGSITKDGTIAPFSADGPTIDGRLNPQVLALGLAVATVSLTDKNGFTYASGPSVTGPVMAGAAACVLQVHPEWTVQQFSSALFFSGDLYRKQGKPDPLFIQGYGIPDVFLAAGLKTGTSAVNQ